jgi:uncharacterized membrane protein YoaK (UPF0700 family)
MPSPRASRSWFVSRARLSDIGIRDSLLVALTVSTGAVDALSWFVLGKVFSAFMTGNMAFLGFRLAGAAGPSVPRVLTSVAAFAAGAAIAARIVAPTRDAGSLWPQRVTAALACGLLVQAAFLATWVSTDASPSQRAGDALIGMSAFAMGIQTAAVFSLGVRAVFTTAATATLAAEMGDLSTRSPLRAERRRLGAVILALVGGAAAGAFLVVHARPWAPMFPLVVSGAVVFTAELARRRGRFPLHGRERNGDLAREARHAA